MIVAVGSEYDFYSPWRYFKRWAFRPVKSSAQWACAPFLTAHQHVSCLQW